MKNNSLPVLCVDGLSMSNVAFEFLAISGFSGVRRCEATESAFATALAMHSPMVVVAEVATGGIDARVILQKMSEVTPDSTLVVVFDKDQEQTARTTGLLDQATYVSKDCLWTLATVVRSELQKVSDRTDRDVRILLLSQFDEQTGLAKRALFKERLGALIKGAGSASSRREIVVMDIERLSLINGSLGRRAGDELLHHVSELLMQHLPGSNHIAHFGGGTFAWTSDTGDIEDEKILCDVRRLAALISDDPLWIDGQEIPITLRSGLALYPDDGRDAEELIRKAEVALRNAGMAGEHHLRYDAGKQSKQISELTIEHQLRRAISRQEFELHYQPKIDIATHRLEGLEALLRWRHPRGHLVSPAEFLPVLESSGLIVDVGKWVIRQATSDCQRWSRLGISGIRVAVNIHPAQLRDPDFVSEFSCATGYLKASECRFDVEITENLFQGDSSEDLQKLNLLREQGVRIAIDDFGTGYSSLSRLSTLPIDVLKIDRAFVSQLPSSRPSGALVQTMISFARACSMITVAEGVETTDQLHALQQLGCDQSQGFLHSPPVAAADCVDMLRRLGAGAGASRLQRKESFQPSWAQRKGSDAYGAAAL